MHPSRGMPMNLRDRLFGDDDDKEEKLKTYDPHEKQDEVAEHGVNTDEDKEDRDGFEHESTP